MRSFDTRALIGRRVVHADTFDGPVSLAELVQPEFDQDVESPNANVDVEVATRRFKDIIDLSDGERTMMMLWSCYVLRNTRPEDILSGITLCQGFAAAHAKLLKTSLRNAWRLHLRNLYLSSELSLEELSRLLHQHQQQAL